MTMIKKFVFTTVLVTIAVMRHHHHDQRDLGEERVYLAYTYTPLVIIEGSQDRNLKQGRNLIAGTDVEDMKECCSLACSSWLAQPTFSQNPGPSGQG